MVIRIHSFRCSGMYEAAVAGFLLPPQSDRDGGHDAVMLLLLLMMIISIPSVFSASLLHSDFGSVWEFVCTDTQA